MSKGVSMSRIKFAAAVAGVALLVPQALTAESAEPSAKVTLLRVPDRGLQPQAASDATGVVHLIYFRGDPRGGDIFYTRSEKGGAFSRPLRVNSAPGSAVAVGNIRGAQLAVGKNGRAHVAWMGSARAEPKAPG